MNKSLNETQIHVTHLGLVKQMNATDALEKILNNKEELKEKLSNVSLVIHGGAGSIVAIPPPLWQSVKFALGVVAATGVANLLENGDAVKVRSMQKRPISSWGV